MNYRYKVEDKEIILSDVEHTRILEATKQGGGLVSLRQGKLLINTAFVRWAKETDALTETQERERDEHLALNPPQSVPTDFLRRTHKDFYSKMGWLN